MESSGLPKVQRIVVADDETYTGITGKALKRRLRAS